VFFFFLHDELNFIQNITVGIQDMNKYFECILLKVQAIKQ